MRKCNESKISFSKVNYGCFNAILEINNVTIDLDVSFWCNPLQDLLQGLIFTLTDEDSINGAFNCKNPLQFYWRSEPNGYEWQLNKISKTKVEITIVYHDDIMMSDPITEGKQIFQQTCNTLEFARIVCNECTTLLLHHGIFGYVKSWLEPIQFPILELLVLKELVKTKKPIPTDFSELDDSFSSKLEYEIKLLQELL